MDVSFIIIRAIKTLQEALFLAEHSI